MDLKFIKKNLKYILPVFLILSFIVYQLFNISITGRTYEYSINDDNIKLSDIYKEVMDKEGTLVLNGKNKDYSFSYTYEVGNITDNKNTNLNIYKNKKYLKDIKKTFKNSSVKSFKYDKKIILNGSPSLKINNIKLKGNALLFKLDKSSLKYVSNITVNKENISFNVKDTKGNYFIIDNLSEKRVAKYKQHSVKIKSIEKKIKKAKEEKAQKEIAKKAKNSKIKKSTSSGSVKPINLNEQKVDTSTTFTCSLTVECYSVLDNMDKLKEGKEKCIPGNGVIFSQNVSFSDGENVYDVLKKALRNAGIALDSDGYTKYSSAYIKGINNLYEKDCGQGSGWLYFINGVSPNFGCSRYVLQNNDRIVFSYKCGK